MDAKQTTVKVIYDSTDISEDISKSLISVSYTDHVTGKADEIEIKLEDTNGLFSNSWYPNKGSRLSIYIDEVPCGIFSIDEVNISGPPDVVTWRGISALITNKTRTKKSKGYEGTSLLQIAQDIAKNHDLTVDDGTKTITEKAPDTKEEQTKLDTLAKFALKISYEQNKTILYSSISSLLVQVYGVIGTLKTKGYSEAEDLRVACTVLSTNMTAANCANLSSFISKIRVKLYKEPAIRTKTLGLGLSKIKIARSTQNNETDLAYLSRISSEYGMAFNIKPPTMVFYSLHQLESSKSVVTVNKSQVSGYDFTDKTSGTYKNADVSYHDPIAGEVITNKKKPQGTVSEQGNLQVLFNLASKAGTKTDNALRNQAIQGLNDLTIKTIKGLKEKQYGDEAQSLTDAYAVLLVSKSVTVCVRFANFCKDLISVLKKLQLESIIENADTYKGGQSSDTLVIRKKVEDKEQAEAVAKAEVHKANSKTRTGSFSSMPGTMLALAGSSFNAVGFGIMDGKYTIISSTHTVEKGSGYTTSIDFKQGAVTSED